MRQDFLLVPEPKRCGQTPRVLYCTGQSVILCWSRSEGPSPSRSQHSDSESPTLSGYRPTWVLRTAHQGRLQLLRSWIQSLLYRMFPRRRGWASPGPSLLIVPFFGAAASAFGVVSFPVDASDWSRRQRAGPVPEHCAAGTAEPNAGQFLPRDRLRSG